MCTSVFAGIKTFNTYQIWVVAYSSHQVGKLNPEGVSEENGIYFKFASSVVLLPDETAARVSPPAGSHDDQQQENLGGSFSVHWNPHTQKPIQQNVQKKQKGKSSFSSLH